MSTITIPTTPPRALLVSMAMRRRHDFGMDKHDDGIFSCGMTPAEREMLLTEMAQLYEEIAGKGFYDWSKGPEQRDGLYGCGHDGLLSVHPRADGSSQCTRCANEVRGLA